MAKVVEKDWRKEYLLLQTKMISFRQKAILIKEKLAAQMEEMRSRCIKAEKRAELAEKELSLFREKVNHDQRIIEEFERMGLDRIMKIEQRCNNLEKENIVLEENLLYEKTARQKDKFSLQAKSAKIKAWVQQTLKHEEEAKENLKIIQKNLEDQVRELQSRLQGRGYPDLVEEITGRINYSKSNQASPTSIHSTRLYEKVAVETVGLLTPITPPKDTCVSMELDQYSNGSGSSLDVTDPQPKRNRKCSIENALEILDKRCNEVKFESDDVTSTIRHHLPSSTRQRLEELSGQNDGDEPAFGRSCPTPMQMRNKTSALHEKTNDFSKSLPSASFRKACKNRRPPTPPRHQQAAWETRIQTLAKNGFQFSSNALGRTISSKHIHSTCEEYDPGEYATIVHKTQLISIPLYANIKGEVQEIDFDHTDVCGSDSSDDDASPKSLRHVKSSRGFIPKGMTSLQEAAVIADCVLPSSGCQRAVGSSSAPRAIKRANSQQSMASTESDYAIPPDALGSVCSLAADRFEPENKLLKTSEQKDARSSVTTSLANSRATRSDVINKAMTTQKSGYLKMFGLKSRVWKKRWFVLKDGKLEYHKTPVEPNSNVRGYILFNILSNNVVVSKMSAGREGLKISTPNQTFHLTASCKLQADEWFKALKEVVNVKQSSTAVMTSLDGVISKVSKHLKLKLVRVKDGASATVWADIEENHLEFHSEDEPKTIYEKVDLTKCVVENNPKVTSKIMNEATAAVTSRNHVISLRHIENDSEIFLYFNRSYEKTTWLSALSSISTIPSLTVFERAINKLLRDIKEGLLPPQKIWDNSILFYSETIDYNVPLTSLASKGVTVEAVKLAKMIQRFCNHTLEPKSTDFHVTIAQSISHVCITHPELLGELFAHLFIATNRRDSDKTSKKSSYLQSWKLFALLTPLFIPGALMSELFRIHLQRHIDSKSEVGQYAAYCRRSMDRARNAGPRSVAPSCSESVSIIINNPFLHSLPISVPVHFYDGSYQVISFHGSTTALEFSKRIAAQVQIRNFLTSGFCLFVNDPETGSSFEHFVDPQVKICDVISAWESATRRGKVLPPGILGINETLAVGDRSANGCTIRRISAAPKFTFRRRLWFERHRVFETDFERLLIIHQIGVLVAKDRFPVTRELSLELTALICQIKLGPWTFDSSKAVVDVIEKFFPARYRDTRGRHCSKQHRDKIIEKWSALKNTSRNECIRAFLNVVRQWPLSEATFFPAKNESCGKHKGDSFWLAVEEYGLKMLHHRTMQVIDSWKYVHLISFGPFKNHLMIVVETPGSSRCKKLLFSMPKIQMFSCVKLMAAYIDSSIRTSNHTYNVSCV